MNPTGDNAAPSEAVTFESFWLNSTLTAESMPTFASRLATYAPPDDVSPPQFAFSTAPVALPSPRGGFWGLLRRRRSDRAYATRPLTTRDLGSILAALARTGDDRRAYPSAGAVSALECIVLVNDCTNPRFAGYACHYDAATHGLTPLRRIPPYAEYASVINLVLESGAPAAVLLLLLRDREMLSKYGERGGRFLLMEAGHGAQNVLLACADRGLACCETGGLIDDAALGLCGLRPGDARVAVGIAVGHRARRRSGRRGLRLRRR